VIPEQGLRRELAEAAHVLSRLGLVTAYGHVSARTGTSMLITPDAREIWQERRARFRPGFL
jgi:ribulose-5-phosphate 4-epimerase/fuculose-1-phosphate aldolase